MWRASNHVHILGGHIRMELKMLYIHVTSQVFMAVRVFPIFYSLFHFWQ